MDQTVIIPEYCDYYPDVEQESKAIQEAYQYLTRNWKNNKYVDIPSINLRTSYFFYYLYEINSIFFKDRSKEGLKKVSDRYETILDLYGKQLPKLASYAALWITTMARSINDEQSINRWTDYYLEHPHPTKQKSIQSRILIDLYYTGKNSYIPSKLFNDILPIHAKLTPFGREFEAEIENYIIQKVENDYQETGENFVSKLFKVKQSRIHVPTTLHYSDDESYSSDFDTYTVTMNSYQIKKFIRNAENEWREKQDLPKIGEGWVHESQLFHTIKKTFNMTDVEQHARPDFLGMQHYDVYLPEYKIACEYQGEQHFKSVSYFGGENTLASNKERDARKKRISDLNHVHLIYVMPEDNLSDVVDSIAEQMGIEAPAIQEVSADDLPSIKDLLAFSKKK